MTPDELQVRVAPLNSRHRTKALSALCEELAKFPAIFPGSRLKVTYAASLQGP